MRKKINHQIDHIRFSLRSRKTENANTKHLVVKIDEKESRQLICSRSVIFIHQRTENTKCKRKVNNSSNTIKFGTLRKMKIEVRTLNREQRTNSIDGRQTLRERDIHKKREECNEQR